jgi:Tfp pilus assembly protein PilV
MLDNYRPLSERAPTLVEDSTRLPVADSTFGWRSLADADSKAAVTASGPPGPAAESARILSRSGFALIEVLMGSGLLGVVAVTMYLGIAQGFAITQIARENLRATRILEGKMEAIRLYSWDQINQPGFIPSTFTDSFDPSARVGSQGAIYLGTAVITNAPGSDSYSNDLRWVSVRVTWTSSNIQRQRSMQTLVSRCGLQNYIYPLK